MSIEIDEQIIEFEIIPLTFIRKDITSVFYAKNNKTLLQTFEYKKYIKLKSSLARKYDSHLDLGLGQFLKFIKESRDINYAKFLNRYGDEKFCEFKILTNLNDKGIYCYIVDNVIRYVGRCTDNFKKRINQGYGKIHPKNCFLDGQATNCHINSLINSSDKVEFGIHIMTEKSSEEIRELERIILKSNKYQWNIQTSYASKKSRV